MFYEHTISNSSSRDSQAAWEIETPEIKIAITEQMSDFVG